jgi:hypothetical protein
MRETSLITNLTANGSTYQDAEDNVSADKSYMISQCDFRSKAVQHQLNRKTVMSVRLNAVPDTMERYVTHF